MFTFISIKDKKKIRSVVEQFFFFELVFFLVDDGENGLPRRANRDVQANQNDISKRKLLHDVRARSSVSEMIRKHWKTVKNIKHRTVVRTRISCVFCFSTHRSTSRRIERLGSAAVW